MRNVPDTDVRPWTVHLTRKYADDTGHALVSEEKLDFVRVDVDDTLVLQELGIELHVRLIVPNTDRRHAGTEIFFAPRWAARVLSARLHGFPQARVERVLRMMRDDEGLKLAWDSVHAIGPSKEATSWLIDLTR